MINWHTLHCLDKVWSYKQGRTYQDSLPACSGRDWCKPPSVLNRRETHSIPVVSVRDGSAGLASATLCSKLHVAALSGVKPEACRPRNEELWHSCWADQDSLTLSPALPLHLFSSSVFSLMHRRLSLPIFLLHPPASTPTASSPLGWWRRISLSRSWWPRLVTLDTADQAGKTVLFFHYHHPADCISSQKQSAPNNSGPSAFSVLPSQDGNADIPPW